MSSIPVITEGAPAHGVVAHLLPQSYKRMIAAWLEEDTPSFDYGGFVVGEAPAEARLLCKSPGVVAGVPFVNEVFHQLDCTIEWHVPEGAHLTQRTVCATVRGPVRKVLLGERVALNILARCSGIATQSAQTLALLRAAGYTATLAGTRKTTPGFRLVEKYGMLVGGADPHRHDLSSMVMLKDNHIWACSAAASSSNAPSTPTDSQSFTDKAITAAVHAAKAAAGFSTKVEVECQTFEEAAAAVRAGADVVMLDNFAPDAFRAAARRLKEELGRGSKEEGAAQGKGEGREFLIEMSGGLTKENVTAYVCKDVDIFSTSAIHQGVKHVDFSLKVVTEEQKRAAAAGAGASVV